MDDHFGTINVEIKVEYFVGPNLDGVLLEAVEYLKANHVYPIDVTVHDDGYQNEWTVSVYYREFTHPSK